MFADMHAALGPHLAQNLVVRCAASDALTLDASILPYLDVVGCQSERFEHLLRNFWLRCGQLTVIVPDDPRSDAQHVIAFYPACAEDDP